MPYAVFTRTIWLLPVLVVFITTTPVGADNKSDFKNATPIVLGGKKESQSVKQVTPEITEEKVQTLKKLGNAIFNGTNNRTTSELKYQAGDKSLATSTLSPNEPIAPTDPETGFKNDTPEVDSNPAQKTSSVKTKKPTESKTKDGNFKIKCKVYFGNGKSMQGWLFGVQKRNLKIEHNLNGNRFRQDLDLVDLKSIVVVGYESKKLRTTRSGEMYEYLPNRIRITKRSGKSLEYNSLPKILKSFRFYSEDFGFARLYTHFADVKNKTGKWRNRSNGKAAHPNAVTKFVFTN